MCYLIVDPHLSLEMQASLKALGYRLIFTSPCPYFSYPVCTHPDLQFFLHPEGILYSAGASPVGELGSAVHTVKGFSEKPCYENEAKLNQLWIGNRIFCNTKLCASISIPKEMKIIHVNQGYANCSSIAVGDSSFITDDEGIARAAQGEGMEVLLLEKGDVRLPGYPYGFIGGASIALGNSRIGFFGELSFHRNGGEIKRFLEQRGITVVELGSGPLCDYGGGILL